MVTAPRLSNEVTATAVPINLNKEDQALTTYLLANIVKTSGKDRPSRQKY